MRRSQTWWTIAVLVLLVGILAGCSPAAKQDKNTRVRIALFPNITHSQALVAREEGLFQKALGETAVVEWKVFNAGPAEIEAMFAGEVDIGYVGPGPAINGFIKSKGDIQIVAGATDAGAVLVTRRGLVLQDLGELSGKRVAVPQFGNTQDLSLRHILQRSGLKDTAKGGTVEIRQVDNPDIKTLMDSGQIDAALVPEPWGSRLVNEVQANILLDYNQVWRDGRYTTAVVIVRTEFLRDHPEVVEKVLRTHVELTEFISKNPNQAKELVNKQIQAITSRPLDRGVLDSSFTRMTVTYDPEKESVLEFAQLAAGAGFVKGSPDLKELFNLKVLNNVLQEKGLKGIQ